MKPKIKEIKTDFRGIPLPDHSTQGREFENILANKGHPVTQGQGPDYPEYDLEVKTKDTESKSANSVGSMTSKKIKVTPYPNSSIAKKIQRQFRVKIKDGVIVSTKVYDFSAPFIQEIIKEAYETARAKIIAGNTDSYIPGTTFGYFEQKKLSGGKLTNSWAFRIPVGSMKKLEKMAQSTYGKLFE